MLEEGINEAGSLCSWIAAATAYANHGVQMVPFYIFYSMFGFQRVGDFIWAAGDMRARGFLLGGTAGRTTLAGEGLQHQDGHSQLLATTVPNCRRLRPDLRLRARGDHPGRPAAHVRRGRGRLLLHLADERKLCAAGAAEGADEGILRGVYRLRAGGKGKVRATLLGSGTILREVLAAAELLEKDSACRRTCIRSRASRAAARGARRRALEPAASRRDRRARALRAAAARRARGAVRRRHRLHAHRARPDPPVGAGALRDARHRWLRPQRFARAVAPASSRSTGTSSRSRRSRRWPTKDSSSARTVVERDREVRHRSRPSPNPVTV